MASPDLIWLIIKDNSSFLVKRNGVQFSREPNNLTNKNSFKYSGLANTKAIGVSASGKGVAVSIKTKSAANKPAKMIAKSPVAASGVRRVAKTVIGVSGKRHYRPDLQQAALARASALLAGTKAKKIAAKKSRRSQKLSQ